jgi:hypothetical protein
LLLLIWFVELPFFLVFTVSVEIFRLLLVLVSATAFPNYTGCFGNACELFLSVNIAAQMFGGD